MLQPNESVQWHDLFASNTPKHIVARAKQQGCETVEAIVANAIEFAEDESHTEGRPNEADRQFISKVIKRTFTWPDA